jgi:hypothetical protein
MSASIRALVITLRASMNIPSPQVTSPKIRGHRAQGKRANRKVVPETADPHLPACRNFHGVTMFSCRPGGAGPEQTVEMGEKIPPRHDG